MIRCLRSLAVSLAVLSVSVSAYIPAVAVNASTGLLDLTDNSTVYLTWNPQGTYSTVVSYQQAGADSQGISKVRYRLANL